MAWFPFSKSPRSLADEAELVALTDGSFTYSLETLSSALTQASGEGGSAGGSNIDDEQTIDDVRTEISRRMANIGRGYPFTFDGMVLTASTSWYRDAIAYVFLLLLSVPELPGLTFGRRLFEEVVTEALARYLGGKSIRFGFPHRDPVPSHPDKAVNYLAMQLGQPRIRTRKVRKNEKDMGVDAVAWKPFGDSRVTKVVLLANCATGANWDSKLGELSIEKWNRMIDFGCNPIRVFAVPWTPNQEDWSRIVDYGHLVLDRNRTASLLGGWQSTDKIVRWCKTRLKDGASS